MSGMDYTNTKHNSGIRFPSSTEGALKSKPDINNNFDNRRILFPLHNEIENTLIDNNKNKRSIDLNQSSAPGVAVNNAESGNESIKFKPSSTLGGENKGANENKIANGNHLSYSPVSEKPQVSTPRFGFDNEIESTLGNTKIPDVNVYQHKKTLAQGMMDLSLFSANANQLRYVLENFDRHPFYYSSVILICLSLLLQVGIGIGLIWNALYNVKNDKEICIANKINNFTVIGIFLVTMINVLISVFGVADPA